MVRLFFFSWQGVKGLAFEPNQLQGVYLSFVRVLVLIKTFWDNIPESAFAACVSVHAVMVACPVSLTFEYAVSPP